jgi:hypothetical protein
MAEIPDMKVKVEIEEARRVSLNPGDVLIVQLAHIPEAEQTEEMIAWFTAAFPQNKVIMLDPGATVSVYEQPLPPQISGRGLGTLGG